MGSEVDNKEENIKAFITKQHGNYANQKLKYSNNYLQKNTGEQRQVKPKMKCYNCNKMCYHNAKDCWFRPVENIDNKSLKKERKNHAKMTVHRALLACI